jgi:glutamine synthetase
MHLRPDPSTVRIVPWATDPTAQVIHDCYDRDGKLVPFAPRSVLRRVCDLYAAEGLVAGGGARAGVLPGGAQHRPRRAAEAADRPQRPQPRPRARPTRIDAVNEFDPLFEDVYDYCEKMELNVDTLIHEVGAGQMEINFFHAHPLGLADEVFLFKRTVREAALRHDMFATFMAKPIAGEPGSAMHIHQSVVDKATGRTSSATRRHAQPGVLLVHRRPAALHPGGDGAVRALRQQLPPPGALHGRADQHPVGHRQPHRGHPQPVARRRQARRVENRVIGADANPYVALAATLACGYLGIKNRSSPPPSARATPTWATSSCRAAWARRWHCCAPKADLHEVLGEASSPSTPRSRNRVRRVHEGDLALGARAPAAARLKETDP